MSSLGACGRASPPSRNEELSDVRDSIASRIAAEAKVTTHRLVMETNSPKRHIGRLQTAFRGPDRWAALALARLSAWTQPTSTKAGK
jgi:hypothetical protein